MKVKITIEGELQISSESELEGYALRKWCKDNEGIFSTFKICVSADEYNKVLNCK
jgi:hypothetical protein